MLKANIQNFIGCDSSFEDADIVIFGAPYDSTTSFRPGTRFGSSAMRSESFGIETYSPYQNKDLCDINVFDSGDIELPFGSPEPALELIEERGDIIFDNGKLPLMIGGEHLVTLGTVRAASKRYPDMHVIHFDAHADLRSDYLGNPLSHACVLRRCHDILGDGRIHQFGIRSGDRSEFDFAREGHVEQHKFSFDGLDKTVKALKAKNTPVYLTVDLDVLDPSEFPGTGTPEAGGVGFTQLLIAILTVCKHCNVVACDVNELSPVYDPSGRSTAIACKILRELLLALKTNGGNDK